MSDQHIDPTRQAFEGFKALPRHEPIWMLNLVRFRAHANYPPGYPDGGQGRTGADAYREYGRASGAVFKRVGGEVVWRGDMQAMVIGPEGERWDAVFIARYPTAAAFLEMVTDPEYRHAVVHRQAAVETSRLIRCKQQSGDDGFG
jgi:uncharacterized protein (DUF1330 family)